MRFVKISTFTGLALALLFILGIDSNTFAQGRGNSGGRPTGNQGGGVVNRPTTNPGIDRE